MWDIDRTLLYGGGVAAQAWRSAFTDVTGVAWRDTPNFGGRTDLDICTEVFATHGVTTCTPERFFERYVAEVLTLTHLFAEQGAVLPGVREVLDRLGDRDDVVQTLVTGNVPQVAVAKVNAFGLAAAFDADIGGYGTEDSVRATLVRPAGSGPRPSTARSSPPSSSATPPTTWRRRWPTARGRSGWRPAAPPWPSWPWPALTRCFPTSAMWTRSFPSSPPDNRRRGRRPLATASRRRPATARPTAQGRGSIPSSEALKATSRASRRSRWSTPRAGSCA